MPLEDFIITVFCCIDDMLNKELKGIKLRERGFKPKLSDSEIITIEIVGEILGIDANKEIWQYFSSNWKDLFSNLGSRANFVKQAANLWAVKQILQAKLSEQLNGFSDQLHMSDGFPIPICKFKRAPRCRNFSDCADYGHCASKGETYYGFKGNVLINSDGVITGLTVTAANIDERDSLWEITPGISGMLIADKGLIGTEFQGELRGQTGLDLQTPKRSNMKDDRPKGFRRWLTSTRRLVETVIGQLTDRFNIQKVRARKRWHLTNRITRKVLGHTVCCFINKQLGNPILQFDRLITA